MTIAETADCSSRKRVIHAQSIPSFAYRSIFRLLPSMKKALFLIVILCCAACASANELSFAESSLLRKRASAVSDAAFRQDVDSLLDFTHPAIYKLGMARAEMTQFMRASFAKFASMGLVVDKVVLGDPSQVYEAASQRVCFIPRIISMRLGKKTGRGVGYLVAIKDSGDSSSWLFLDSEAFKDRPELLSMLIPGLPDNLVLPANEFQVDH